MCCQLSTNNSTKAHKTSLTSVETDDVSLLFRYLDGFFFYGFFLTFDKEDLFHWVDPKIRDTSRRDFDWYESMWKRNLITNKKDRYIGKLFSLSSNLPNFQKKFPDAKIIYMIRDPLSVIPSGLSLVTGVLDKRFNFWSLDESIKRQFIKRLYNALIELLLRFQKDWENQKIDKEKVFIVRFDSMMEDFDTLMVNLLDFLDVEKNDGMMEKIKQVAKQQRQYKSGHKYDLEKFELTKEQIQNDCKPIYSFSIVYLFGSRKCCLFGVDIYFSRAVRLFKNYVLYHVVVIKQTDNDNDNNDDDENGNDNDNDNGNDNDKDNGNDNDKDNDNEHAVYHVSISHQFLL